MTAASFSVVVRQDALTAAAKGWREVPALALDTEFLRERTYYPRPSLIQISDGSSNWLLDLLALEDLSPLAKILAAERPYLVIHAAGGDLEVLRHVFGSLPRSLVDTQVAAVFAGVGRSLSYQALVREILEIDLAKDQTRTNWMTRPLTPEQLSYAAQDVAYLLPLEESLRERLLDMGRWDWVLEDCRRLLDGAGETLDPHHAYQRIRGAGRLDRRQLGALKLLAAWRDEQARARDLPRGFVIRDAALLALARKGPRTMAELKRVSGLDPKQARRDAPAWLQVLDQARALPEDDLPPKAGHGRPPARVQRLQDRLRDLVLARAQDLDLPADILAPKSTLQGLALAAERDEGDEDLTQSSLFQGWRREQIGQDLLDILQSYRGSPG
jgi:ribonuclease D